MPHGTYQHFLTTGCRCERCSVAYSSYKTQTHVLDRDQFMFMIRTHYNHIIEDRNK